MKQDIRNKEYRERKAYVTPSVKVIEVAVQRVVCTSTMEGTQNESYGSGETSGWY